jgi:hypothetical protein
MKESCECGDHILLKGKEMLEANKKEKKQTKGRSRQGKLAPSTGHYVDQREVWNLKNSNQKGRRQLRPNVWAGEI